jgi:hypothetical protein
MTDNHDSDGNRPREPYEPPQAVRLNSVDFAYGACDNGGTVKNWTEGCYRGNGVTPSCSTGNGASGAHCITGKSPSGHCASGLSPN